MTTGLLIRDKDGRTIMDPDTFTVRMVTMFNYWGGGMSFGERRWISVPSARAGMFVQLSPLWQYPRGENLISDEDDINFSIMAHSYKYSPYTSAVPVADHLPCMPSAWVTNGYVVVDAPAASYWAYDSRTYVLANVAVYLLVNI